MAKQIHSPDNPELKWQKKLKTRLYSDETLRDEFTKMPKNFLPLKTTISELSAYDTTL
jgi:hypothetical protein